MITIYIGKSGAGKDTFLKKRLRCGKEKTILSYTSRPSRDGEVQGKDYIFVSKRQFEDFIKEGNVFFEWRAYNTLFNGVPDIWYYGTSIVKLNGDYILTGDLFSVYSYIEYYGAENIDVVYVTADDDIRKERAKRRGTFSEVEWNRRLADDTEKYSEINLITLANTLGKPITIINNNGDKPLISRLEPVISD